jgi:hypothetical protein
MGIEILTSKKFQTAILAAVVAGVASYTGLPTEQIWAIVSPLCAYIVGQGLADFGKSAAQK